MSDLQSVLEMINIFSLAIGVISIFWFLDRMAHNPSQAHLQRGEILSGCAMLTCAAVFFLTAITDIAFYRWHDFLRWLAD